MLRFVRQSEINWSYFEHFFKNIWWWMFFMLPLHSLLRTTVLSGLEEAFFERIYINREVVQEARHVAICVLGRINEPINSSSEVMGMGRWVIAFLVRCFLAFNLFFLLLNQGDSFWTDYSRYELEAETVLLSFLFAFYLSSLFYNGEFDPGSGWTLATGLTHASRGETTGKLASSGVDRRTGE